MTIPPRYGRPARFAPALARIPEQSRPRCIGLHADFVRGFARKNFPSVWSPAWPGRSSAARFSRRGRRRAGPGLPKTPIPETRIPGAGGTHARLAEARVAETRVPQTRPRASRNNSRASKRRRSKSRQSKSRQNRSLSKQDPLKFAGSQLEPLKWSELAGWATDDHLAAFAAYEAGCPALARKRPTRRRSRPEVSGALGMSATTRLACGRRIQIPPAPSSNSISSPWASPGWARAGDLLTGYYEPVVQGSRFPSPNFRASLSPAARLVAVGYKRGWMAFPTRADGSVAAPRRRT